MRLCIFVALILAVAPAARAEDVAAAKEHFRRGTVFYDMGKYAEAAKEYSLAFENKDDPALLFNIAQAHRLAGNAEDALRAYKGYLRRVPDTPARAEVEARIRDLQDIVDRQRTTRDLPPTGVMPESTKVQKPAEPVPSPSTSPSPEPAATPVVVTRAEAPRTPVYKKWWLWTAVAGGAVAIGLGVGLGLGLSGDGFDPSLGRIGPGALTGGAQ